MRAFKYLLILLLIVPLSAFAESWICPICGQENNGNFCPNDAQPRQGREAPETDTVKLEKLWKSYHDNKLTVLDSVPTIIGKLLVADYSDGPDSAPTIISRATADRNLELFPDERMADNYDEADTVIFVYAKEGTGEFRDYTSVCFDVMLPKHGFAYKTVYAANIFSYKLNTKLHPPVSIIKPAKLVTISEVENELSVLLNNHGESNEEKYKEACEFYDEGLFYSAFVSFNNSLYGDWAERASACIQSLPENGEVGAVNQGGNKSAMLTIKVNQAAYSSFFARIYLNGEAQTGLFINGNDEVTITLPVGNYSIKAGTGKVWYGVREAFGKEGKYQMLLFDNGKSETTEFLPGYVYTLGINVDEENQEATGVGNKAENWEAFVE